MYGSTDKSLPQRILIFGLQCLFLAFVAWFLFFKGYEALGFSQGNEERKILLFSFCLVVFLRMNYMMFFLLKRGITWEEAVSVPLAFAIYYIGFTLLGSTSKLPIDWIDYLAISVFITGSLINTISEVMRERWKKDPRNKGHLYTKGLFKYAIHINYFGDLVWVSGFALLTRNSWSILVPALLFVFFVFYNIPLHDKYLINKYGKEFEQYRQKTKKLIPFIY
ncbi:MAG: DUF1295 domain-containing protein [Thermoactinomyces sp.]